LVLANLSKVLVSPPLLLVLSFLLVFSSAKKCQGEKARTPEAAGNAHDKKIRDDAALTCTSAIPLIGESGFQGLEVGQAVVSTPFKRKRKKKGEPKDERSAEHKAFNTQLSKRRISIEHSHAGIKRSRRVSDILRTTRQGMSEQLMMVAMGLHTLPVSVRASSPF
jgi:hypothetical protein